jgi:hypothetical protein
VVAQSSGGLRRAGTLRPLLPAAAVQRERFRVSLQDAVDGVDIVELQSGRPRPLPAARRAAVERFRDALQDAIDGVDIIELQTGAAILPLPVQADPEPDTLRLAAPLPTAHDATLAEAVVAPLLSEIAALRAEVERLRDLPAEVSSARRRDLVATIGALFVALGVALVVLTLVPRGSGRPSDARRPEPSRARASC